MNPITHITEQVRQNPKLVVSDDFEFAVIERDTAEERYVNGAKDEVTKKKQTWITLRLIQRKSPGIASVSGDSKEAVQYLIECASRSSEASKVDPWFRFPLWRAQTAQLCNELEALNTDEEKALLRSQYLNLSKQGFELIEEHQVETEKVTLIRKQEKNVLTRSRRNIQSIYNFSLGEGTGWLHEERRFSGAKIQLQREALAELIGTSIQLASAKIFDGEEPWRFVLGPRVVALLLQEAEKSFLASTIKEKTVLELPECITLIDDGTALGLTETAAFDMEGSLMEKTVLVDQGVFKTLLHNAHSATKENRISTGNFVLRSSERHPVLGFTNFYVEKGKSEDLLQELEDGVFIERVEGIERKKENAIRLLGWGFRVKGGKLTEPFRRIPLTLDPQAFLRTAKSVGQDLEFFGNVGAPSILFEKIP